MDDQQLQLILASIDKKLDLVIESQASLGLLLENCIQEMHETTCNSKEMFLSGYPGSNYPALLQ